MAFTNAWEHFYGRPDLYRDDELHLNDVGAARLGRLLNDAATSYSKNSMGGGVGTRPRVNEATGGIRSGSNNAAINSGRNGTAPRRAKKTQPQLSVLYTNARSLTSKRDELNAHASLEKPDIIAVTETWAGDGHLMSEYSIQGYSLFHKNRVHKKGGGVMCYVSNTLSAVKINKLDMETYDSMYIKITTKSKKKLILAVVYRPPKQCATDDLALYDEIRSIIHGNDAIIVGDFNCPNIDWSWPAGDPEGTRLIGLVEDEFLSQAVNQPTRENNILDLVMATDPDLVGNCEVGKKAEWERPPTDTLRNKY